jgi:hypothetical protein
MRPYIGLVFCWGVAAFAFYNSYYGIRYPEKYIHAQWTVMRGLPKERDSAATGAAISMLAGGMLFLFGLVALHAILAQSSGPVPPLP